MSKNFWQIRKQSEQFKHGKSATSRVKAYTATWEERCYSDGIPDELPNKLLFSGRAPSYKAIAICILSNDLYLKKLGLSIPSTEKGREIERQLKDSLKKTKQIEMF